MVIPKGVAEALGVDVGQHIRITAEGEKIVIEPIRDAVWLALHAKKVGHMSPEELEEESLAEQNQLKDSG